MIKRSSAIHTHIPCSQGLQRFYKQTVGIALTNREVHEAVRYFDYDQDGKISFQELMSQTDPRKRRYSHKGMVCILFRDSACKSTSSPSDHESETGLSQKRGKAWPRFG